MRLYPLKLQPQRLSPFLGTSFRRFSFSQESGEINNSNIVPSYGRFIHPLQFGLTYTSDKWHFSASGYYNYQNEFDYYISPTQTANVRLNPVSVNLSLLRYIDTDRHFRTPSAAAQLNDYYKKLKSENLLSAWFFGIGPSAALQMNKSTYLKENHPFLYDNLSSIS